MAVDRFVLARRARWQRLQQLLDAWDRRRLRPLSATELAELGRAYRQVTADLAIAQRDFPFDEVTPALNALVARGHSVVYVDRGFDARRLLRFVTHDYPRAFRAAWPFLVVATLLLLIPGLIGYVAASESETARSALVGRGGQRMIREAAQSGRWADIRDDEGASTASFIMTNNIRVSFLAYAGGMLAGVGAALVMISNGLSLGAVAGAAAVGGAGPALWTFVAAHGVIEMTVIVIAGAAGLIVGWAMLRPGLLSRRDAIVTQGRRSIVLVAGGVPLLMIAGTIEGNISPAAGLPWQVKAGVSLVTLVLLYGYLLVAGRTGARDTDSELETQTATGANAAGATPGR